MNSYTLPALALKRAIRGAVARGYCHEPNATKVLDPALCDAIASEVQLELMDLFAYERPQPPATGPSPLDNQSDLKSPGPSSPTLDNGCATPTTPAAWLGLDNAKAEKRSPYLDYADPAAVAEKKMHAFREELASLINRYSMESGSNTPDFILGRFLADSLAAFDDATRRRSELR